MTFFSPYAININLDDEMTLNKALLLLPALPVSNGN